MTFTALFLEYIININQNGVIFFHISYISLIYLTEINMWCCYKFQLSRASRFLPFDGSVNCASESASQAFEFYTLGACARMNIISWSTHTPACTHTRAQERPDFLRVFGKAIRQSSYAPLFEVGTKTYSTSPKAPQFAPFQLQYEDLTRPARRFLAMVTHTFTFAICIVGDSKFSRVMATWRGDGNYLSNGNGNCMSNGDVNDDGNGDDVSMLCRFWRWRLTMTIVFMIFGRRKQWRWLWRSVNEYVREFGWDIGWF